MAEIINLSNVRRNIEEAKEEKSKLLYQYKKFVDDNFLELYEDDWYTNDPYEHPNKEDIKLLYENFIKTIDKIIVKSEVNDVLKLLDKLKTYQSSAIAVDDKLTNVSDILYFFYLYNIYGNEFINLSDDDLKMAMNIIVKTHSEVSTKYLNHCCDVIVNNELYSKLKSVLKNETQLVTSILSINGELNDRYGINTKESSINNRTISLYKIVDDKIKEIDNFDLESDFNIGIFEPKDFVRRVKEQAQLFFDLTADSPYGDSLEELRDKLDGLLDDLYSIDDDLKNKCYNQLKNVWKSNIV